MAVAADIQKIQHPRGPLTITLKKTALNVFDESREDLWTFDLAGRPTGMYVNDVNYRRTLNNSFFIKSRFEHDGQVYRDVTPAELDIVWPLLDQGLQLVRDIQPKLPEHFQHIANTVTGITPEVLDSDAQNFNNIYKPISILPPDQYLALVVQMTEGCNYNKCLFCNFYRDRKFIIKTEPDFQNHLRSIKQFFGEGISLRKSIFLADANALVVPTNRLIPMLDNIQQSFPELKKIFSFIDVFTGVKKNATEFKLLFDRGLRRVYLGLESGSSDLLEFLHKPQIDSEIRELSENLKNAGISLGLIFLVGAGGKQFHTRHVQQSIELIEKLPISKGDLVYISEFYQTNPEYQRAMEQNQYQIPDRFEIREMALDFKSQLKTILPKGVAASVYDIQQFFY